MRPQRRVRVGRRDLVARYDLSSPSASVATEKRSRDDREYRRPEALAGARPPLPGGSDDRPGHDDRERRSAVDQGGSRLLRDRARLGRERVPAYVRRLSPARRPVGRPLWVPPAVSGRDHALHAGLAWLRPGELAGISGRGAGGAGARRRGRFGGGAIAY